ncbi:hypothetical protein Tco_1295578, partial [Tanacetum coccineum]
LFNSFYSLLTLDAQILGYGDLVQGNIMINRVAFRKSMCFVRDLQGNDLLIGNRGSDLYTNSLQETTTPTPICLMDMDLCGPMRVASINGKKYILDFRSTNPHVVSLSIRPSDKLVSWMSKKQDCTAMSSAEAEYVALSDSYKDGDGDASFQLKSDSLPHAHAQTTKTYYKHQDSRIKEAQELKEKDFHTL